MLRVWVPCLALLAASSSVAAGWNPKLAAAFLDERQKQWFAWPVAARTGGPCVSCHTGLPYLIARPALRRALGEDQPTQWETGLRDALRARLHGAAPVAPPPSPQFTGVESILAALFLPSEPAARERLWKLQLSEGAARGSWTWFELELDPWENTEAPFFGAALAALAVQDAPAAEHDRIGALTAYLKRAVADQPLQNRLTLLWTASRLPGVAKREWIDQAFAAQEKDGGWTAAALGPWKAREQAPPSPGSNAYATAFAAFALGRAGVPARDPRMSRALEWLRTHQNPAGYWDAVSMNKSYPAGSMQEQFMRDAATAFAAAALLQAER